MKRFYLISLLITGMVTNALATAQMAERLSRENTPASTNAVLQIPKAVGQTPAPTAVAKTSLLADDEGFPIQPDTIEITPQMRPGISSSFGPEPGAPRVNPVSFLLVGKWKLTSIKVYQNQELATNEQANPLWHMTSDSNSIPVKAFFYGERIRGMRPAVPRARPLPLQPDVDYVLLLESGSAKGQATFRTRAVPPSARQESYGEDLREWHARSDKLSEITHGRVAWTVSLDPQKRRLFHSTRDNPLPNMTIATIDFISTSTDCFPFLLALTCEE